MIFKFRLQFIFSITLLLVVSTIVLPLLLEGQVRESTNYKIERDSINIGGGLSTSTNYSAEDTIGEVGTGRQTSTNYGLDAGYQQPQTDVYISITSPNDLAMSPIGFGGGVSSSSVAWNVTTNNTSGYSLTIEADTSPALTSVLDAFDDYTPVGANPDYTWSIPTTAAEFGYSVLGSDTVNRFKDDGVNCNTGSINLAGTCWDGLSTTPEAIAGSASANEPSGATTTVEVQAEVGVDKIVTAGDYSAAITVTAVTL